MNTLQIGDIVVGNNSWLNGMLGFYKHPGVVVHVGHYSSVIYLFIMNQDFTLMNDYIDKITLKNDEGELKIGDLVELKPELLKILNIGGVGTIIDKTIIETNDFDGKWTDDKIDAFLVYFSDVDYEYTIPCGCLRLFSTTKID